MFDSEIEISDEVFLPVYRHLVDTADQFDIDFLYGGRDSGKSRQIAQQLVLDCLGLDYFRCVLIRNVKETVKDSQWQLIKDVVDEWGMSDLFTFTTSPLSIRCKNGNTFLARGCDDTAKLKSITEPSHCWIEEGNQIGETDFVIIMSTLRSNKGKVKTWFSFNPECEGNYQNFWLYKDWFAPHSNTLSFEAVREFTVEIDGKKKVVSYRYRATHTTYKNNPYCSDERKALYESYAGSNGYYYNVYTLGRWGYKKTGGEFWKQFKEEKHVKDAPYVQDRTVHIVLDNNVSPYVTVSIWQMIDKEFRQIHEIPCESPDNNAPKAALKTCSWLRSINYGDVVFIYGDPSGNNKSTIDANGASFFDKFIEGLKEQGFTVERRIDKGHPQVALSRAFIDEIYEKNLHGYSIVINKSCTTSIEDYTMAKEAADGTLLKTRVMNKETKQTYEKYGHFSDTKRYFIIRILSYEFKMYRSRSRRSGSIAA